MNDDDRSSGSEARVDATRNDPINVEFTSADSVFGQAYVSNRSILYDLWEFALVYPNIASKIEIFIRRADAKRDYYYESSFADSALVVSLRWTDTRFVCDYLSCNTIYPERERCKRGEDARIFPSGDETTLTACEPACFFVKDTRSNNNGERLFDTSVNYRSARSRVMRNDGTWYSHGTLDSKEKYGTPVNESSDDSRASGKNREKNRDDEEPDMPFLEYDESSGTCEISSAELLAFITVPRERSVTHDICRQDNFRIGDDYAMDPKLGRKTGRHSRTYCNAFHKNFDTVTMTCEETMLDKIISFTFLGNALIRLSRHAIYGDRCNDVFPTDPNRREVDPNDVPEYKINRRAWFNDVDKSWKLPPPNILLSDLGIFDDSHVWSSKRGIIDYSTFLASYAVDSSSDSIDYEDVTLEFNASFDGRAASRKYLQRESLRRSPETSDESSIRRERSTRTITSTTTGEKKTETARLDNSSSTLLDYDDIYESFSKDDDDVSSPWSGFLHLTQGLGIAGASGVIDHFARKLIKRSFERSLRFVGRTITGKVPRIIMAAGLRAGATKLASSVALGLSKRMILFAATTATGVGAVLTTIEILAFILDTAIMAGWDPGNYKSEFDNKFYDDLVDSWIRKKRLTDTPPVTPRLLVTLYNNRPIVEEYRDSFDGELPKTWNHSPPVDLIANVSENTENLEADHRDIANNRFLIDSRDKVPWFFSTDEKFEPAIRAILSDERVVANREYERDDSKFKEKYDVDDRSLGRNHRSGLYTRDGKLDFSSLESRPPSSSDNDPRDDNVRDDPLFRIRPIMSDKPMLTNMLWSMQYFRFREYNSYGQYMDHSNQPDTNVNDETIRINVRSNQLASMLEPRSSAKNTREILLGAARQNFLEKHIPRFKWTSIVALIFVSSFATSIVLRLSLISIIFINILLAFAISVALFVVEFLRSEISGNCGYSPENLRSIDKLCDLLVSVFRDSSFSATSSPRKDATLVNVLTERTLRFLSTGLRDELRVILDEE